MYTRQFKRITDLNHLLYEITGGRASKDDTIVAFKQLYPVADPNAITIHISESHLANTLKKWQWLIDDVLNASVNTETSPMLKLKLQLDGAQPITPILEFMHDVTSMVENVRCMLFHKVENRPRVADLTIEDGIIALRMRHFDFQTTHAFYQHNFSEDRCDTELLALWYAETYSNALFGSDVYHREIFINFLRESFQQTKQTQADIEYCRAMLEFRKEQTDCAVKHLHVALAILPDHLQSLQQLADQLFHEKKYSTALLYYDRAIAINSSPDFRLHQRRIACLIRTHSSEHLLPPAIIDLVRNAHVLDYKLVVQFLQTLQQEGQPALTRIGLNELIRIHEQALHLSFHSQDTHVIDHLCFFHMKACNFEYERGQNETALDHAQRIIEKYEFDHEDANRAKAIILFKLGKMAEFEEQLNILKVLQSQSADTFVMEGGFFIRKREYRKAFEAYHHATQLSPSNCFNGYFGMGHALAWMKRDEEAIPYFQKSLEISPKQPRCLSDLGSSLLNTGNLDQAIRYLDKAIELDPNYYHPHYVKACLFSLQKQSNKALAALERAIACDPATRHRLEEEPNFDYIRELPAFQKLMRG